MQTFLPAEIKSRSCASQHFGAWAIESKWFRTAMAAIANGTLKPMAETPTEEVPLYVVRDGVAIIPMEGQMTRGGSSFGGCSTVATRAALRDAVADRAVGSIVLAINSPGGTVAGTSDLADEVKRARKSKGVYAVVSDMCCSAAYWVASQCETIFANNTAVVGSVGTYSLLEDDTGSQEKLGIKYTVVSTGEYKGLGADGAVSDKLIADVKREVNELNVPFLAAVKAGRGSKIPDVAKVADGRAHVGAQAMALGLIDFVDSFEGSLTSIVKRTQNMTGNKPSFSTGAHMQAQGTNRPHRSGEG